MSLWSRIENVLRGDRLSREIDEELLSHVKEAIEQGRDPAEARRAFGSTLRRREESRDTSTGIGTSRCITVGLGSAESFRNWDRKTACGTVRG